MGKSLDGKELGNGILQKKDGRYEARFTDRFGNRKSISGRDLKDVKARYNEATYENFIICKIVKNRDRREPNLNYPYNSICSCYPQSNNPNTNDILFWQGQNQVIQVQSTFHCNYIFLSLFISPLFQIHISHVCSILAILHHITSCVANHQVQ